MRKCKKAYGRRDWRRRGGIYRRMKRVNKSIRRCDERRRKRWRRPRARHMMSWTLRKEKIHCTDWRYRDTKRERTYNRSECWALRDVPCRDVAFAASVANIQHYTGCEGNKKADKCVERISC